MYFICIYMANMHLEIFSDINSLIFCLKVIFKIIQIVNLRPKQALEVQLIVEECEERLSEEELDELVETICRILPKEK